MNLRVRIRGFFRPAYVERSDKRMNVAVRLSYVIADAVLYVIGLFLCIEAALLRIENVFSLNQTVTVIFPYITYLFASRAIYVKLFRAPLLFGLLLEYAATFAFTAGAAWLVVVSRDTSLLYQLPLWWDQLPGLLLLFLKISPLLAIWLVIAFSIFSVQVTWRRPLVPMASIAAGATLVGAQYACVFGREGVETLGLIMILVFAGIPIQAALRGRPRLFSRTLLIALVAAFSFWHFAGLLPVVQDANFADAPGVEKLLPARDGKKPLPPALVSSLAADPAGGLLYAAGGTSGKLLGIDVGTGAASVVTLGKSNITRVKVDPWTHNVYALKRDSAELLRLAPGTLRAASRDFVKTDWGFAPSDFVSLDDHVYVTYSERPGIAEFDLERFEQRGGVQFRREGMTSWRTGGFGVIATRGAGAPFALAGVHGSSWSGAGSTLVRIDPLRFVPNAMVVIPDSVNVMTFSRDGSKIFAAGSNAPAIYEIDSTRVKVLRSIKGPRACSALAADSERDLIYAVARFDGTLSVIDANTGGVIDSRYACNKIAALEYDGRQDRLFLACVTGIYKINLSEYLKDLVE